MRWATLSRFCAFLCLGSVASCGSGSDSNLLLTLSNLPARAMTLSLSAQLDGKPATMNPQQVAPASQVGVVLPNGTAGHFVLTVQALDADGCVQASGKLDTQLSGLHAEFPVALAVQSPRMCGNLAPCAAGTICSYTPKPVAMNLWGLWASSPTDIWAVGDSSTALHYDGTKWQDTTVPIAAYYNGVWGSGPKDVWAVGQSGAIIHYNGQMWTSSPTSAIYDLSSVYGVSATDVWAVGASSATTTPGEFWHWNGTAWSRVTTGYNGALLSVWASATNDLTASGVGGLLLHYDGTAWTSIVTGTTSDLRSVWGASRNLVFAGGVGGTLLRNNGTGWKTIPVSNYAATLYGLGGDGTTVYGVGNSGANGNSIKGTAPFDSFAVQTSGNANSLTAIVVGSNGIGWVTGKLGYLGYFDTRP